MNCGVKRAAPRKRVRCSTPCARCMSGASRASPRALGASPESELLIETLAALENLSSDAGSQAAAHLARRSRAAGTKSCWRRASPICRSLHRETLRRARRARFRRPRPVPLPLSVATAQNDEHELEMIASWCRAELERDPRRRLLIVDAKLRQRRGLYERLLSQTLAPSEWLDVRRTHGIYGVCHRGRPAAVRIPAHRARASHTAPAHGTSALRRSRALVALAVSRRRRRWPAPQSKPAARRQKLDFSAEELAAFLERAAGVAQSAALAARLRTGVATLGGSRRTPAEWSPRHARGAAPARVARRARRCAATSSKP